MNDPKLPKNYALVPTLDGSLTLYSERFGEACHSNAGAMTETDQIYLEGNRLRERIAAGEQLKILEVGFGTGLGVLRVEQLLKEREVKAGQVEMVSLEIDPVLIEYFIEKHPHFEAYELPGGKLLKSNWLEVKVLIGDAREQLPKYDGKFNIIFQDAFSPRRNPRLWTREWFELLFRLSAEKTTLTTYSATSAVRKAMLQAGWRIYNKTGFNKKKASTYAQNWGESGEDLLAKLERSPAPVLTDDNWSLYRDKKI